MSIIKIIKSTIEPFKVIEGRGNITSLISINQIVVDIITNESNKITIKCLCSLKIKLNTINLTKIGVVKK